jgi:hypothetical protein
VNPSVNPQTVATKNLTMMRRIFGVGRSFAIMVIPGTGVSALCWVKGAHALSRRALAYALFAWLFTLSE